ncbi:MAG TPA: hypothetical protein VGS07_19205 [Thermoanaerobaculia bacterium]|jgi:hypothetical protein|nr:hypothetical protein [Thermoanaerobaculia bacterium]
MKFSFRRHRNLFAAALLLLPASPKTSTPAPAGKFEARVLITAEPEKVLHSAKGATAQPATTVARGRLLVGFIFFKDCKADKKGNCNVDVDVQGLIPGGAAFINQKGTDLWRNKQAPHAGFVQLGGSNVKIQTELKDPAGTYRLIAVAHDRNSGAQSRAEASFEVK